MRCSLAGKCLGRENRAARHLRSLGVFIAPRCSARAAGPTPGKNALAVRTAAPPVQATKRPSRFGASAGPCQKRGDAFTGQSWRSRGSATRQRQQAAGQQKKLACVPPGSALSGPGNADFCALRA